MLGSATHREASWSRSNFSWGTFRCRRQNATLAASSGFDQPSMIALASSLILELRGGGFWKVSRPTGSYLATFMVGLTSEYPRTAWGPTIR